MKKSTTLQAFIVCALAFSLFACGNKENTRTSQASDSVPARILKAGWQEYTGTGFSIAYPPAWTKKESAGSTGFMTPIEGSDDFFQENVNVLVQDLAAQPMNLDQYTDFSKAQIKQSLGDSSIESLRRIKVGGMPADEMIYKMKYQEKILTIKGVWMVSDNKAYVITYAAEPEKFNTYLADADEVCNSFRLKNAGK